MATVPFVPLAPATCPECHRPGRVFLRALEDLVCAACWLVVV